MTELTSLLAVLLCCYFFGWPGLFGLLVIIPFLYWKTRMKRPQPNSPTLEEEPTSIDNISDGSLDAEEQELMELRKLPGGIIFGLQQKALLPEDWRLAIPSSYHYIHTKAGRLVRIGHEAYRANDYFQYPLTEWDIDNLDWGTEQITYQFKGIHAEHPIESTSISFIEQLFQTFHFNIKEHERIEDESSHEIWRIHFAHMVTKEEISLYFRFAERKFTKNEKPPWAYWARNEAAWQEIVANPQATNQDCIDGGIGEFGLTPSNPIPASGVLASYRYLNRLKSISGSHLTIERREIGGVQHPNIYGITDKYYVTYRDGEEVKSAEIYLNIYHLRTSKSCPSGFRF